MDEKVYGFCENKCKQEVVPRHEFEEDKSALGGWSIYPDPLTQEEYNDLENKDSKTLYITLE